MKIAIRKEKNGLIYIDKELRGDIKYTEEPYNFTIIDIDEEYGDCDGLDFNDDLTFSVEKYNARKNHDKNGPRINELKFNLSSTDYKAIKYAEGLITEEEYAPVKQQRQAWRDEINRLEEEMKK